MIAQQETRRYEKFFAAKYFIFINLDLTTVCF